MTTQSSSSFFDTIRERGIHRGPDAWFGGVSSGLAARMGVDPLIVRAGFLLLTLFGGFGLVLYGLGWLLLPDYRDGRIHFEGLLHGQVSPGLIASILMTLFGLLRPGFWWVGGPSGFFLGSIVVALIILAVYGMTRRPNRAHAEWPTTDQVPAQAQAEAQWQTQAETPYQASPATPPPAQSYTPPPEQPYSPPPVKRRNSMGRRQSIITLGLALLASAGVWLYFYLNYSSTNWMFAADFWVALVASGAVATIIFGLSIVWAALRGKSSGWVSLLAILTIICVTPLAFVRAIIPAELDVTAAHSASVGSSTFAPTTVDQAEAGSALGLGELYVDLTQLALDDTDRGTTVNIPVSLLSGEMWVTLPVDARVELTYTIQAGVAYSEPMKYSSTNSFGSDWQDCPDCVHSVSSGTNQTVTLRNFSSGEPQIRLTVGLGAGVLNIHHDYIDDELTEIEAEWADEEQETSEMTVDLNETEISEQLADLQEQIEQLQRQQEQLETERSTS